MFYRFNVHRHTLPNQKKTADKPGRRAVCKVMSLPVKIQRRLEKFTDIHTGGLPKILPALMLCNLAGAAVLLVLSIILLTGAEPAEILPTFGSIRMPTLPDHFTPREGPVKLTEFELYLDSLEKAFRTDSINETRTLNK
ncbi:hypothetical protein [Dyadobacter sp. CY312]|uniref:hypothetical protein n=1 Tax=Dyadobacter sp. CY312 TaxID=2907303 RepID=UPI001F32AABE|nr:hypothetical protein [Dyadobacter sp. CY312]MCE7044072.1 hypothetical protein [Dyadobacter sp. CY312]